MHIALFLFLIFSDVFEGFVPMANYWDELATVLVVCWGGYSYLHSRELGKGELGNWICLAVIIVIGALSNLFHPGLQDSKVAMIKDVVALCKFPAIFIVLERMGGFKENREKIIEDIAKLSRVIVIATLLAAILGRFVDLGFYTGEVRILPTFRFVFSHPTFFISSYVMIAAALIAESIRKNRIFLLLDCLLIFMAQRTKGYVYIAFVLLCVLLGEKWTSRILSAIFGSEEEKIKPGRILFAVVAFGVVFSIIAKPRIEHYINVGFTEPRTVLPIVGIRILMDFFPLGSGFGTFASHLSGKYYSNIYAMYGIDNVWGMTQDKYNFISDVFWPYIYGQFGILGLLLYGKLIISNFFLQFKSSISASSRLAVAAVWIYALIASTSEAYFTNGTGVQMALFLGLLIGYADRKGIAKTVQVS